MTRQQFVLMVTRAGASPATHVVEIGGKSYEWAPLSDDVLVLHQGDFGGSYPQRFNSHTWREEEYVTLDSIHRVSFYRKGHE